MRAEFQCQVCRDTGESYPGVFCTCARGLDRRLEKREGVREHFRAEHEGGGGRRRPVPGAKGTRDAA